LLDQDLVIEASLGESAGGRKPRLLQLDDTRCRVLGIDIAAERTTLGIADLNGIVRHKKIVRTARDPGDFLRQLLHESEALVAEHLPRDARLEAIGVGTIGLVDAAEGSIIYASNLDWHDVPVGAALRQRFHRLTVVEANVRAAGLAELWFGGLDREGLADMAVVVVDEGIGAAIFSARQLLRGSTGGAGQFGHVPLDPEGPTCRCGSRGCWEALAAEPATVSYYLSRLSRRRSAHTGDATAADIIALAAAGEPAAVEATRETARYLGLGLAILVNAINPALIVLEAALTKAWHIVEPEIWNMIRQRALAPNYCSLRIEPSRIEKNPGLMGAVSIALERRFTAPGMSARSANA
ncbi:MAG: ROK family protein, partial [Bryobacteraceae bacterium]